MKDKVCANPSDNNNNPFLNHKIICYCVAFDVTFCMIKILS
jgi:hypothetical protein